VAWATGLREPEILNNLIAEGKAKPMTVVIPNEMAYQDAPPDISSHFIEDKLREVWRLVTPWSKT
jgi:hypothetical protein